MYISIGIHDLKPIFSHDQGILKNTHLFVSCSTGIACWSHFRCGWARVCNNVQLADELNVLGHLENPINNLSPVLHYIYHCKKVDSRLKDGSIYVSFPAFLQPLKQQSNYEEQIFLKNIIIMECLYTNLVNPMV